VGSVASFVAGFINAIAGGGGLVSVPALLGIFPRAPAAELFGTNKVAMVSGTLQAAGSYARRAADTALRALGPFFPSAAVGARSPGVRATASPRFSTAANAAEPACRKRGRRIYAAAHPLPPCDADAPQASWL